MTEKLAGVISAIDEHYLDELIETDPLVQAKWGEMQAVLDQKAGKNGFKRFRRGAQPDRHTPGRKPVRLFRLPARAMLVAASIAAVLLAGWAIYTWQFSADTKPDALTFPAPAQQDIELSLADGRRINLSREQGTIATGDIQLNNAYKTLSYKATQGNEPGINTLKTPVGKDYKVKLSDGTEVWLNSATLIRFPFDFEGDTREITIDGEAYLEVAEDAGRPFIVRMPETTVHVLGTSFNVNSYDPGVEKVALLEGAVSLESPDGETAITPGTEGIYTAEQGWSKQSFNADAVLSWQQGLFYFYDANLEEICRVLPRWFGIDIVIDNPGIESKRFAGVIERDQPIGEFLDNLKAITDIEYYFARDNKVLHFRNPGPGKP